MINWLDQNEFVWLGRMLTGYNLRFSSSSKTTNYVLPINYEENRYELVENFIWVPFKWPIFTVLLSFTQWSIFYFWTEENFEYDFSTKLYFDPEKRLEIWRFFTTVFIHSSSSHLWQNLFGQFFTSACLEIVYGWKATLILYFSGAFFANLVISVYGPFQPSYGSSGAVFALITGHLAAISMNWNQVWLARWRCCLINIYLYYSLRKAMLEEKHLPLEAVITGHSAHFGGALGGLLVGFLVLGKFGEMDDFHQRLTKYCRYITVILVVLGVIVNYMEQIHFWSNGTQFYLFSDKMQPIVFVFIGLSLLISSLTIIIKGWLVPKL